MSLTDASLTVDRVGQSLWIVGLHGEHDLSTVAHLRDELAALFAEATTLVVDLSDATFIDSSVVRELILAQQRVDEDDQEQLAIIAPQEGFPARVIELAGADRLFCLFERRADALRWAATIPSII